MIIAFVTSVTLLPALLTVLQPAGRAAAEWATRRWRRSTGSWSGTASRSSSAPGSWSRAGLPLLYWLQFDFNPLNLQSPKVESVATFLELRSDPALGANSIYVLTPNLEAADADAEQLAQAAARSRSVKTIESFIPADQEPKLAAIRQLGDRARPGAAGRDRQQDAADRRRQRRCAQGGGRRLAAGGRHADRARRRRGQAACRDLAKLAEADPALRERARKRHCPPAARRARRIARLPARAAGHARNAAAGDRARLGHARTAAHGRGPAEGRSRTTTRRLRQFARAVLAVEPNATGRPIRSCESGRTVIRAFFEAGVWALVAITILLWIVLRRFGDVLLTLVPLLMAGVVTMECWCSSACRSTSPTSSRCRCCSASASPSRSTTSWRGGPGRPTCCSRA